MSFWKVRLSNLILVERSLTDHSRLDYDDSDYNVPTRIFNYLFNIPVLKFWIHFQWSIQIRLNVLMKLWQMWHKMLFTDISNDVE